MSLRPPLVSGLHSRKIAAATFDSSDESALRRVASCCGARGIRRARAHELERRYLRGAGACSTPRGSSLSKSVASRLDAPVDQGLDLAHVSVACVCTLRTQKEHREPARAARRPARARRGRGGTGGSSLCSLLGTSCMAHLAEDSSTGASTSHEDTVTHAEATHRGERETRVTNGPQRSKRPLAAPSQTRCVETMKSTVTCRLEAAGSALGRNSRTATSHWALRLSGSAAASLCVAQPSAYRVSPTKSG